MHAFIFTMFIIAIKTGHSIPERLFGKESGRGAGMRRSRGKGEAGGGCWGRGLSPLLSWGSWLPAQREGGRVESAPSAAQGAWGAKEHPLGQG